LYSLSLSPTVSIRESMRSSISCLLPQVLFTIMGSAMISDTVIRGLRLE